MKKYFVGIIAVAFAIVSFAFSARTPDGPDCDTTSFVWFHVKLGTNKTVCSNIISTDFVDVLDPNQNGVVDAGELSSLITSGALEQGNGTISPFGCPDLPSKVCALSYDLTANPITVVRNASNQWVFRPTTPSDYKCCIKRTQN